MPNSRELANEIKKLEGQLKEQIKVEELTRKKAEIESQLKRNAAQQQPQKQSGFKRFLSVIAAGEQRRQEIEAKTPKKPYKPISFNDIGFKV